MVQNIPVQHIKMITSNMEFNDRYVTLWQVIISKMVTTVSPIPTFLPLKHGVCVVSFTFETWQAVRTVLDNREQLK